MDDDIGILEKAVARAEQLGRLAQEAAETSVRVFEELISDTAEIGKVTKPVTKRTAVTPAQKFQEGGSKTEEPSEASTEAVDTLARTFGEVVRLDEDNLERNREAREVHKRIETRLEYLARMYSSDKAEPAEGDDVEEEG